MQVFASFCSPIIVSSAVTDAYPHAELRLCESAARLRDYDGPTAFAIPGNHDYIDGLETFQRHILHKGWLGGWCDMLVLTIHEPCTQRAAVVLVVEDGQRSSYMR